MLLLFLFVVALLISAWISLALHESAHALIGRLRGMQIAEIRLGTGPELVRSRLRGTEIRIGLVPIGGRADSRRRKLTRPAIARAAHASPALEKRAGVYS